MWVMLYLVGSGSAIWQSFLIPVQKGRHGTTVHGLEDVHLTESLSTEPVVPLNPLKSMR